MPASFWEELKESVDLGAWSNECGLSKDTGVMQLLSIRSSVVTIVCKFAMQSSLWPLRQQTLIVGLPESALSSFFWEVS